MGVDWRKLRSELVSGADVVNSDHLNFFDAFAGVGGFRIAFEREGFRCVGWCEIDRWCQKLYRYYYKPEGEYFKSDIFEIDHRELPEFDVITAGIPCQPFSTAGKRKGMQDYRGLPLWKKFFEIVEAVRPKVVVVENVKGLLSSNRGWDFAYILNKMDEIGYDVEWDVLNSKDFGVPQNRGRLFVIGHLRGKSRPEVFPIEETDRVYYTPTKNISGECEEGGKRTRVLVYDPYNRVFPVNQETVTTIRTNAHNGNAWIIQCSIECLRKLKYLPINQAITDEHIKIRKLTPLECFRLQGFPDDIVRVARNLGISDTNLYRMAGNAVTIPVVQSIARKLKKILCSKPLSV